MSEISIQNLSFTHEGSFEPVFTDVSFRFDTAWKLGLTGRNGRGKTTLLRLLQGAYPYEGTISAPGVRFAYFPYAVDAPARTALAVLRAQCPGREDWELERELSLLALREDALARPFARLSQGEQTKVLLAAMFLRADAYLLIDEPTNHLDAAARQAVAAYLRRKRGYLLVSHDRDFLDGCVDHILSINRSDIQVMAGNFSVWQRETFQREQSELARQARLRQEVRRLQDAAAQTTRWSDAVERTKYNTKNSGLRVDRGYIGHKSAKMMARARQLERRRQEAAAEKAALLQNRETAAPLRLTPLAFHTERLVEVRGAAVSYGGQAVLQGVDLTVRQGERVALTGPNGCGKTTLLRLILGELPDGAGAVARSGRLILSQIPQSAGEVRGSLEAFLEAGGVDRSRALAVLRKLGFERAQFELPLERYSAGQKKKLLLTRSLLTPAHLYVWDEPLNYIDVVSRMQIEELILESRPTLLFVEHDQAFCRRIATRTVSLAPRAEADA